MSEQGQKQALAPDRAPDLTVDARHLLCPLPILRVESGMAALASGALLVVRATDPGLTQDLPAWCAIHGHHFLGVTTRGREMVGRIMKR